MLQGRTNHSRYHLDYSSLTAYCHSRAPSSPKPVTGRPYSTTQICILRRVNSGVRLLSFFRTGSHQPPALCSFRKKLTSVIVFVLLCCEIAVSIAYHRSKVKQNLSLSCTFLRISESFPFASAIYPDELILHMMRTPRFRYHPAYPSCAECGFCGAPRHAPRPDARPPSAESAAERARDYRFHPAQPS